MTGALEVIRAGAGSGKTTDLCRTVAAAVAKGLDPASLVATTFTRKAASELRRRVQAELLNHTCLTPRERQQAAERLELAAIGTVHSVGHELVSRYAIPLGLSPQLDVLDENGSERALRDLIGILAADSWDDLAVRASSLSIANIEQNVLTLLNAKRANRISDADFRLQMRSYSSME